MNAELTSSMIKKYPAIIVGVKIRSLQRQRLGAFRQGVASRNDIRTVLFVECHLPKYSLQDQLARMRPEIL